MGIVAILALIPGLALAAEPAKGINPADRAAAGGPLGLRMSISATTERIPLPRTRGPVHLFMDALAHNIRLVPSKGDSAAPLLARVAKHVGFLCPKAHLKDGAVELTCRNARIEAQITVERSGTYLDINELRGLPWRAGADAPPSYFYDPWRTGLGQSCPGKSPAARGECELKNGRILEAAGHFRAALETTARQLACVRLGDLAVATGDPITGAGWYRRAGYFGTFGRVAEARLCELDGKCLPASEQVLKIFDSTGLPEPLRAEMVMRAARAEAYMGRLPSAAHLIARQVRAHGVGSICREDGELLCRRILLEAMRLAAISSGQPAPASNHTGKNLPSAPPHAAATATAPGSISATAGAPRGTKPSLEKRERDYLEELMETYLALPGWEKGPLAIDLAQAAAPLGVRLGAPAFSGNLLASLAPQVPAHKLSDHLLLTAETFMEGANWPRARIVAEYAQTRLTGGHTLGDNADGKKRGKGGPKGVAAGLQGTRWNAVFRALSTRAAQDEVSSAERTAIDAEFAATLTDLKRARDILGKAASTLRGTAEARSSAKAQPSAKPQPSADAPHGPATVAKNLDKNLGDNPESEP